MVVVDRYFYLLSTINKFFLARLYLMRPYQIKLLKYCSKVAEKSPIPQNVRCIPAPFCLIITPRVYALKSMLFCLCHKEVGFCNERGPRTWRNIAHQLLSSIYSLLVFSIMDYRILQKGFSAIQAISITE